MILSVYGFQNGFYTFYAVAENKVAVLKISTDGSVQFELDSLNSGGGGGLNIEDDGNGNVSITSTGQISITDDGEGNVTIR
jgi:hypothetical protein